MKYSLEDVFQQSLKDDYAISLNGDGYKSKLVYGIKIVRDDVSKEIQLLNTMAGGDYYKPLTIGQENLFKEKG